MKKKNVVSALILAFIPVILCFVFEVIGALAYFAIIFFEKAFAPDMITATQTASDAAIEEFMTNGANSGLFYIIKFTLFIIVFGWWYHEVFANPVKPDYKPTKEKAIYKLLSPGNIVLLMIFAYSIQLFVDGVLYLLSIVFPDALSDYGSMISNLAGSGVSVTIMISVMFFAPIAEEICFRGLTMKYASLAVERSGAKSENAKLFVPVIIQAVIFGLYHGNLIQGTYACLSGILLGVIAKKTDSLIPGIILHSMINISAYLVPMKLYSTYSLAILVTFISLVAGVLLFILFKRIYSKAQCTE